MNTHTASNTDCPCDELRDRILDQGADAQLATWTGEELVVTFRGVPEKVDYGVPGSPVWDEIHLVEIESVTLLGTPVDPKTLPAELVQKISDISDMVDWAA